MIVQLVVATGNRAGQVIPISEEKFIIGRAEDCHLRPQSELISRYHCAILVKDQAVVRDLGSKNGIRLNGEKVTAERTLNNGDKLTVGPLEFYVHITDDAGASLGNADDAGKRWEQSDGSGVEKSESTDPTVLLDHLKALNQEGNPEAKSSESNPLQKLL